MIKVIIKTAAASALLLFILHCNNNGIYDLINSTTPPGNTTYRVFVSSYQTYGDMGFNTTAGAFPNNANCAGFSGADKGNCMCQEIATYAGISTTGTFRAWLSDSTRRAQCNIIGQVTSTCMIAQDAKYVDMNGNTLFNSWYDIATGGYPLLPISTTEIFTAPPTTTVWTGTLPNGAFDQTCSGINGGWTDKATLMGTVGNNAFNNASWTQDSTWVGPPVGSVACAGANVVYCFEGS